MKPTTRCTRAVGVSMIVMVLMACSSHKPATCKGDHRRPVNAGQQVTAAPDPSSFTCS